MATVSEIVDLDSGVASSEATPEGQTAVSPSSGEGSINGEEILQVSKEMAEELSKEMAKESDPDPVQIIATPTPAVDDSSSATSAAAASAVVAAAAVEEDEEEDEDVDESLGERLVALTEMFPDCLRSASSSAVSTSVNFVKSSYHLTRQVVWIAVSTSIILFAPVMFELERLNVEEMMKQDRNRLVLGPGSAVSGPPATPGGMMPPPPAMR